MKRFLLPLGLALSIHGLVLKMDVPWFEPRKNLEPRPLTVSLIMRPAFETRKPAPAPPRPLTKPAPKPPAPADKKKSPAPASKPRNPRRVAKPLPAASPQETTANPPVQTRPQKKMSRLPETPRRRPTLPSSTKTRIAVAAPSPSPSARQVLPAYRRNPPPVYPVAARRRGYEGTVVLEVLVSALGTVDDLRVFRSSGFKLLDQAAMRAVKSWLFEPGRREGHAVAMWVKVPVRFQLR